MFQSDDRASTAAEGSTRKDLKHELKRCSLEILRRRELIESIPTFVPLTIAATPLFEVALEIACQVTHSRTVCAANDARQWSTGVIERCLEAVNRLSGVRLYLPDRRCTDFFAFWFENDENRLSSERSLEPTPEAIDPDRRDANSQLVADYRPDNVLDASMSLETDLLEESFDEPTDVGGDMNITPEFVYIANRVFDDTETLIARFAVQLQSTGRELIELLGQIDPHVRECECVKR